MKRKDTDESADILKLNARRLRGKQSVRATFSLPEQIIGLLKVASAHLRVQQKSLIDQLVEDRMSLEQVAAATKAERKKNVKRRQKTFVLSRNSLELLDEMAKQHNTSRDHLIELSVSRLMPFLDAEQEKHKNRRMLILEVERHLSRSRALLDKADKMLGPDDTFKRKLEKIVSFTERTAEEMKKSIKEKETLIY